MRTIEFVTSRRFVAFCVGVMVVYMFGWSTKWTFDPSYQPLAPPDYFFTAQADALLHGRLWVDPMSLRPGQSDECWFVSGRCYGYFGLTPSLLRVPILLILGASTASFAPIMIPLAAGVAFGASLDLCRQLAAPMLKQLRGASYMCVAALTLGPGSVLVMLADPYVYQEAILWAAASITLALNLYWRWLHTNQMRFLRLSIVACVLAAGARPTALAVGAALGLALFLLHRRRLASTSQVVFTTLGFVVLPIVFCIGAIFIKFGHTAPPSETYRNPAGEVREKVSGFCAPPFEPHLRYVPTTLYAYLRPDAVRLWADWPFVRFRFAACTGPNGPTHLWPLQEGDLYVEKTTSLSNTMPIPLLATFAISAVALRRRWWREVGLLSASATAGLGVAMNTAITSRYLGDFYPLLAVGFALSGTLLVTVRRKSVLMTMLCSTVLLGGWSVVANASLLTRYGWMFL